MRIRKRSSAALHRCLGSSPSENVAYLWRHGLTHLVLGAKPEDADDRLSRFDYYFRRLTLVGGDDTEHLTRQASAFGTNPLSLAWSRLLRRVANLVASARNPAVAWLQCATESDDPHLVREAERWVTSSDFDGLWARRVDRPRAPTVETRCVVSTRAGVRAVAPGHGGVFWAISGDGELTQWHIDTGTCRERWSTDLEGINLLAELDDERVVLGNTSGYRVWWTKAARLDEWQPLPGLTSLEHVEAGAIAGVLLQQRTADGIRCLGWPTHANSPRATDGDRLVESALVARILGSSFLVADLLSGEGALCDAALPIKGVVALSPQRLACWGKAFVQLWHQALGSSNGWHMEHHHACALDICGADRVSDDAVVVWPPERGDVEMVTSGGDVRVWKSPWVGRLYKGIFTGTPRSLGHGNLVCASSDRVSATLASLHVPSGRRSSGSLWWSDSDVGPASNGRIVAAWPEGPLVEMTEDTLVLWSVMPLGAPSVVPIASVADVVRLGERQLAILTRAGVVHVVTVHAMKGGASEWSMEPSTSAIEAVRAAGAWAFLERLDDCRLVIRSATSGMPVVVVEPTLKAEFAETSKWGLVMTPGLREALDGIMAALPDGSALSPPPPRSIDLSLDIHGRLGEPLRVTARAEGTEVTAHSTGALQAASKAGLSDTVLREKLGALGGTAYRLAHLQTDVSPGLYISGSDLSALRRDLVERLKSQRIPLVRFERSSAGWLLTLASGEEVEWVSNDPGNLWDVSRAGVVRTNAVVSLWRGSKRITLAQGQELGPEAWVAAVSEALKETVVRWVTSEAEHEPEAVRLLEKAFRDQWER